MNGTNLFKIALRALANNKLRAFLTMLGIIIGVASVIAMLAIGQGSKKSIQQQISEMGSNMIMIHPGAEMRGGVRQDPSAMQTLKLENYEKLLSSEIPCIIFSTNNRPGETFLKIASKYKVPVMLSEKKTSPLMAEIIRWLNVELAPTISIHGVLVDVYGEGVLITGESGIGKSEAALELIKRGHRLVSDDVVEIRKVSDETLVGSAPDITRHFIELRGIGIIDVKTLFGVEAVKNTQAIDMVINLEDWDKDKEYDRLGLEDHYTEFLGNKIVCHNIPIRPGRNLAIIVESAAVNYRQKKMGYNAARELYNRVQQNLARRDDD